MVFGFIPECRSASVRNERSASPESPAIVGDNDFRNPLESLRPLLLGMKDGDKFDASGAAAIRNYVWPGTTSSRVPAIRPGLPECG
jgi:hypothetical protein